MTALFRHQKVSEVLPENGRRKRHPEPRKFSEICGMWRLDSLGLNVPNAERCAWSKWLALTSSYTMIIFRANTSKSRKQVCRMPASWEVSGLRRWRVSIEDGVRNRSMSSVKYQTSLPQFTSTNWTKLEQLRLVLSKFNDLTTDGWRIDWAKRYKTHETCCIKLQRFTLFSSERRPHISQNRSGLLWLARSASRRHCHRQRSSVQRVWRRERPCDPEQYQKVSDVLPENGRRKWHSLCCSCPAPQIDVTIQQWIPCLNRWHDMKKW